MKAKVHSRDIMTLKAFENALTVLYALGGSTNAVLHLLALAHEADVPLVIDDFNRIGDRVPLVANLKPHGKYSYAGDFDSVGGLPVLMKMLLQKGLLHGDCMTCTGKTVAQNLGAVEHGLPPGQVSQPKRLPVESPWSQFTGECQRFCLPPRLNEQPF